MKTLTRNWKTTLAGLFSLSFAALQIYHNPASLTDPNTIAAVTAGVGLIVAKDGGQA